MARDMKDTGGKAKRGVLEGSFTRTETAMKVYGSMDKQMDKAYMYMQMVRSTLVNSIKITRMAMEGKSGAMGLHFKANSRMERNTVKASSNGQMGAAMMENSITIKYVGMVFTLGRTKEHTMEAG